MLLDQGAQYYCLNLDIQVMKFLVLLMAPGFYFLWMTPLPKMTYHGYRHSLFLPHPLQYHTHMLYLVTNIIILILLLLVLIFL